jgi:glycosyltransferase involved in cell wall biosynthesis
MPKRRSIVYVQYTNPAGYPPLEHSSRILADDGWDVLFLGTGSVGTNELRFPAHPNISVQLVPFQQPGWRQKLHYLGYVLWCVWRCLVNRPTAVYCSDAWSTPVGVLVWYVLRVPVIYHEHDTPGSPTNVVLRVVAAARRRLACVAKACVIPNEDRRRLFHETLQPKRSICVWNCPAKDEIIKTPHPIRALRTNRPPQQGGRWGHGLTTTYSDDEKSSTSPLVGEVGETEGFDGWAVASSTLTLWYHGSLNQSQYPGAILHALALLPKTVQLKYAGYETVGHKNFIREFQDHATTLGVVDRVQYVGKPPTRTELYTVASTADIGLSLFAKVFREPMAGASNKPFDYLACGLALLVTNTREWTGFYDDARAADPDSPDSIAAAIQWFLDHLEETRAMGERGRQRILTEWNYETQFTPVKQLLESLVR